MAMLELTPAVRRRLEAYAEGFAALFRRRDQAKWFGFYLQGLLAAGGRKNVETLARQVRLPPDLEVEDPAQALQNFVNQSPWDERRLWQRFRTRLAPPWVGPDSVFVIEDIGFPKHGRQSVGVQRQFCPGLGRKVSCQLAVSLSSVGADGVWPLLLRLYLPRNWLRDPLRLRAAGVPPEHQSGRSRSEIALDLLDEVRGDVPGQVVVGSGAARDFRDGLARRGFGYLLGVPADFPVGAGAAPVPMAEWAEGKGWDVVSRWSENRAGAPVRYEWGSIWLDGEDPSRAEALALLVERHGNGSANYALSNLSTRSDAAVVADLWQRWVRVRDAYQTMREHLGLDHFEGRSWRGFHHHACLVMLAYGFVQADDEMWPAPAFFAEAPLEASPCR